MKMESQKRHEHILFLATENVILHVNQPYKIRQDMIESKNFIPEAFLMHQLLDSKNGGFNTFPNRLGEGGAAGILAAYSNQTDPRAFPPITNYFSDEEDDDEDWDDEDEDWDDEDEEWDDEDEEWDDEDEDWEDEDEDLDEDEDWSDEDEE